MRRHQVGPVLLIANVKNGESFRTKLQFDALPFGGAILSDSFGSASANAQRLMCEQCAPWCHYLFFCCTLVRSTYFWSLCWLLVRLPVDRGWISFEGKMCNAIMRIKRRSDSMAYIKSHKCWGEKKNRGIRLKSQYQLKWNSFFFWKKATAKVKNRGKERWETKKSNCPRKQRKKCKTTTARSECDETKFTYIAGWKMRPLFSVLSFARSINVKREDATIEKYNHCSPYGKQRINIQHIHEMSCISNGPQFIW